MDLLYTTDRLILKVLSPVYSKQVLSFYKKNRGFFEIYEPDRIPNFYTENFQRANLTLEYDYYTKYNYLRLWIYRKDRPDEIIGTICFSNMIRGAFLSCMVGYKIDASNCKHGYATEALNYAIHQIIFKEYGFHRVEALIHPTNEPSLCLIDKLGFVYEGVARKSVNLRGQWEDHIRYSLVCS